MVFLSSFHPQTDGQTERHICTLWQVVQALGHEHWLNWLEAVTLVEMALNNTVNNSTRMLPAFILYSELLHMPVDLLDGMLQVEVAQTVVRDWTELCEKVEQVLLHAQAQQKRYANAYRRNITYAIGDLILLAMKSIKLQAPRKLQDHYVGPFKILERIGKMVYRLDLSASKCQVL